MCDPKTTLPQIIAAILWLAVAGLASPAVAGDADDPTPSCPADARWGLVIDAGSSGSRLRFYCWRPGAGDALPWVEDVGSKKVEPGIADDECGRTPEQAVAGLRPLVDYAIKTVGGRRSAGTPLRLMATAGLRKCPKSYQDAILSGIRRYLAETPFADPQADLISGTDEGRYGWTSVNYLLERFDSEQQPEIEGALRTEGARTVGALDLGGVSTQITFLPRSCSGSAGACEELEIGDRSFQLYAHSYLGWGQSEAMRRVASRACYLRGYSSADGPSEGGQLGSGITGRGRYAACRRAIRRGMARELRSDPPEPACTRSCNRLGAHQPPLTGDLLAFSAFAYNTEFLGLASELTLAQLRAAGKEYCRTPWRTAQADCRANPRPGCKERWLNRYCFASAYIVVLLHEVYGLPMDRKLTSTNQLAGADIDWTLGVMVQIAEELSAISEP